MILCLLPFPNGFAVSGKEDGDDATGGTGESSTEVTVDGEDSDSEDDGDEEEDDEEEMDEEEVYPQKGVSISEIHLTNNTSNALWNPLASELPNYVRSAIMRQGNIAVLYDGWIDLEHQPGFKPEGATRPGETLGYDIYARLGEVYTPNYSQNAVVGYTYTTAGLYGPGSEVNYTWAIMHLYRALGIEKYRAYVITSPASPNFDITQSPMIQMLPSYALSAGLDLSKEMSSVTVTRTDPEPYMELAMMDGINTYTAENREEQYLSVADFCTLAYSLMQLYGEPVLTPQETRLLLDVYGAQLPYGLPSLQLEAVEYLMARGIIGPDMEWRSHIEFKEASEILMRIKDTGSRMTFKDIQLSMDVDLLDKGYYATELSTYQSPIEVLEASADYSTYTEYDYFIEIVDAVQFKATSGYYSIPFIGNGVEYNQGVMPNVQYIGRVSIDGKSYYHFKAKQTIESLSVNGHVVVNTPLSVDTPAKYFLPSAGSGNEGGCWTYTGKTDITPTNSQVISTWEWTPLDSRFPAEYCDKARKDALLQTSQAQMSILNASTYGYTFRTHVDDLDQVKFKDSADKEHTLKEYNKLNNACELPNGMKLTHLKNQGPYHYYEVTGCSNKDTLTEVFTCGEKGEGAYQSFPAFAKHDGRYLVSIDYLKAIGVVWEFTKTGENSYYIGINVQDSQYSSVYIGTSGKRSFVIRGSQLTLYDDDVVVVMQSDTGYFVDYAAVLGVSHAVSFPTQDGKITLSRKSGLEGVNLHTYVYNMNSESATANQNKAHEVAAAVTVSGTVDDVSVSQKYIYCPIDYPLANWLVVDNQVDGQKGVFTFYASKNPDTKSDGAKALEQMLGISTTSTKWDVYYNEALPTIASTVEEKDGKFTLKSKVSEMPKIAYIESSDAYLIRVDNAPSTYGAFSSSAKADKQNRVTSIVNKGGTLLDWNYNIYNGSSSLVWRYRDSNGEHFAECSNSTGNNSFAATKGSFDEDNWIPAPAGIPGMIGYPASVSSVTSSKSAHIYSGIAYRVRGGEKDALAPLVSKKDSNIPYCIIHATPNKTILQSCGFTFTYLKDSPLNPNVLDKIQLLVGGALASFDWEAFFKDLKLENLDGWISVAIIAVLSILPRIFMFMCMMLMILALLADTKPWVKFCDSIFDPYKFLTAGRQTVHTIRLRTLFTYSFVALCLYGTFQNGLILEVIAWIVRSVTGILVR